MNQQQQLLASVKSAIYALNHPEQPSQLSQADSFLREFSTRNEAWEVAGNLILHSQNVEERFFGAQILYLKLNQNWSSLHKHQQNQIRELIIQGILTSPTIHTMEKLCMCLAIFTTKKILETDEEITAVKLFSLFSLPNVNMDFVSDDPNPQHKANNKGVYYVLQAFLIWLACLAERIDQNYFDNAEVSRLRNEVGKAIDEILKFCMAAITNSRNHTTQNLGLKCLKKWVEYGLPFSYLYQENSVLDLGFKCLLHPSLFEESTALMTEIFSQRPKSEYDNHVRKYMLKLVGLSSFYEESLKKGMVEVCRELVKLAVALGESNTTLIAAGHPECIQLVQFICMCVRNPDTEIVELTFDFWYTLQCQINGSYPENRNLFKPIFTELATILISQCRFPVPQSGEDLDHEDLEDLLEFRRETADVLTTVYEMLFGEYFNLCMNGIKQGYMRYQHNKSRWQLIESSLFAIVSVADCVKEDQLTNLIPIVQMFNDMPSDIIEIRRVQVQILGSYAHWVGKQQEDFIIHAINFTLQSVWQFTQLNLPHRTAAAIAFCSLCERSEKTVTNNVSLANTLTQTCVGKIDMVTDTAIQVKLYEGLSHILIAVEDPSMQLNLMHSILGGVITRIKNYHDVVKENHVKPLIVELQKLKASMKAFDGDRGTKTLSTVIQQIWTILCETMISYKGYNQVVDAFCRLFECMICSVGVHPETLDFMNNVTLLLYDMFYELPYPSFLRTINMITYKIDGQSPTTSVYQSLANNYVNICRKAFDSNFVHNDELIIDFFKLQHSIVKSHPQIFFGRDDVAEVILDHAVLCLEYQNMEVATGVVKFLVGFLDFDLETNRPYQQIFAELVKHVSPKLVPSVLKAILFEEHPASRELARILHAYRPYKKFLTTFTDNFIRFDTSIPALQVVPQAHRNAFAESIARSTTLFKIKANLDSFKKKILEYSKQ